MEELYQEIPHITAQPSRLIPERDKIIGGTNYIFLVTPPNVDISGDIPELVAGGIDLSTFNSSDNKF